MMLGLLISAAVVDCMGYTGWLVVLAVVLCDARCLDGTMDGFEFEAAFLVEQLVPGAGHCSLLAAVVGCWLLIVKHRPLSLSPC